ncbi:MAG TPA: MFS transporter, partial [Nitrososphaerales archaeon]|nr:MFS transporter [Nitrososphaerales archaeon]
VFAVAGINGVFAVFFDTAYASYLPSLVESADLVEGNSKLQTSASAATVIGPTVAGVLIGLVGAAISVLADAAGYFVSTLAMLSIKKPEPSPKEGTTEEDQSILSEIKEGLSITVHTPVLAIITVSTMMANFGNGIASPVSLYFIYDQLGLSPLVAGLALTFGGLGLLLGALVATRVSARIGLGRALAVSLLAGFGWVGYPLALVLPPIPVLIVFSFISSVGTLIFTILGLSLIQSTTPNRVLGRINATRRTFSRGVIPLGSILAGILGQTVGLPWTIVIGGLISGGSAVWALLGPIYNLK